MGYIFSSAIIAAALVLLLGSTAGDFWFRQRAERARDGYLREVVQNPALSALTGQCTALARESLTLKRTFAHRTTWARFLVALGSVRPAGLNLDRLGSNEQNNAGAAVNVAITGWCSNKEAVNRYIARLQDYPFIGTVKLISMESDRQVENLFRFKFVCTLKLIRT
jgi:Tfp pilus assembly protein PilN